MKFFPYEISPGTWQEVVEITPSGTTGNQTVGLGAYVPSGTTCVIIRAVITGTTSQNISAHAPGTTNYLTYLLYSTTGFNGNQVTLYSGVDSSQQVVLYRNSTDVKYYLLGFLEGNESTIFSQYKTKTLISGSWQTLDLSEDITTDATFAIFEVGASGEAYGINFRKNGSSDNRTTTLFSEHVDFIVPLDNAKKCQYYCTSAIPVRLIGYIKYGTGKTNALELTSITNNGTYQIPTEIASDKPSGATAIVIEINGTSLYSYALRKMAHAGADDIYHDFYYQNGFHIVGLNGNQLEIKSESGSGHKFWIIGYVHPYTLTGNGSADIPALSTNGEGVMHLVGSGSINIPSLSAIGYGPIWGSGLVGLPVITISGIASVGHYGTMSNNIPLPSIYLDSGGVLTGNLTVPTIVLKEEPYIYGSLISDLPLFTLDISGLQGNIGSMSSSIYIPTIVLSGHTSNSGTMVVNLPVPKIYLEELIEQYGCVVLNITNRASYEYNNYNFNSLTKHRNIVLLASKDGIYLLGGNDDNGTKINSSIKTVRDDFGVDNLKNIPDIIVGMNGGTMKAQTYQDNTLSDSQTLDSVGSNMRNRRVKLSLGRWNRYWGVKLSNFDGSDFKIDSIKLPVNISKRSINE